MNGWEITARILNLASQFPLERLVTKPDYTKSEQALIELKAKAAATDTVAPVQEAERVISPTEEYISPTPEEIKEAIEAEKQGDYCVSCLPSKHYMRVKDALLDAINIAKSKGEFTKVAERKIQNAVYHLNAAEEDLERAVIPEDIKPATDAMHTQTRNLRRFLRQDASGLEVATIIPKESFDEAKANLEAAYNVVDEMINMGYELAKLEIKVRGKA